MLLVCPRAAAWVQPEPSCGGEGVRGVWDQTSSPWWQQRMVCVQKVPAERVGVPATEVGRARCVVTALLYSSSVTSGQTHFCTV